MNIMIIKAEIINNHQVVLPSQHITYQKEKYTYTISFFLSFYAIKINMTKTFKYLFINNHFF